LPSVLDGLCTLADENGEDGAETAVTAIVTVTDEGGSSGRLRKEFGVLPPGDIRNCLAAASHTDSPFRQLLQHRFTNSGALDGHSVGNVLLTALTQMTGDFVQAVDCLGDIIGLRGRVLPATCENVRLKAELASGDVLTGETAIVGTGHAIRRMWLEPSPRPVPEALRAIVNADAIVVGPGSLYTSLLPNLLVEGVASTISGVNAVRIYVANLMTEPGETDDYTLDDHLRVIRAHTGFDLFDYVLVNRRPVSSAAVERYAERGSQPIVVDRVLEHAGAAQIVECDLAIQWHGEKIRHHPASVARAIRALVTAGRPGATALPSWPSNH
jgi:uncharacterized cofD-like protein